jgi:hypothetical protein
MNVGSVVQAGLLVIGVHAGLLGREWKSFNAFSVDIRHFGWKQTWDYGFME